MSLKSAWIVDDDVIFTFTLRKMLEVGNLVDDIEIFPNGLEAKKQLETYQAEFRPYPDVIFLDINMPILDGWQFMDEFSQFEDRDKITVYLVSSSIDPKDKEKAKRYRDIKEYVVKPMTIKELKLLMKDVVSYQ